MASFKRIVILLALALPAALADFMIYIGGQNDLVDGGM